MARVIPRGWTALVMVALAGASVPCAAQDRSGIPCSGDAETPSFLTAANDIYYGCGYLVVSTPPEYALAASNFHLALAKEQDNAIARFLLGVSLAGMGEAEKARAAFAEATRRDPRVAERVSVLFERRPALRALVEGVRAPSVPAPPATPGETAPAPERAASPAPPAAPVFPVGGKVEVEHTPGTWVPGVVTAVDAGPCPYYRVGHDPYGDGVQRDLGFFCKSVRAPTGVAQPRAKCGGSNPNCPPTSPPPLGRYTCDVVRWDVAERRARPEYQGYFVLLPGGRYRWLDNGGIGTYAYDAATHRVQWRSGPMQARGGSSKYGLDGTTPEITITLENDYSRRTGNPAPRWQCGLQKG